MIFKRLSIFLLVVTCCPVVSFAQSTNPPANPWGTWGVFNVSLPESKSKFGAYAEVQARANKMFDQFFYYELKGGLSYDIAKNFTGLVGLGRYVTYDPLDLDKGSLVRETRLWEQMTINQYFYRLKFEHRYRVEQRFLSSGFKSRIRYRMSMVVPINKPKLEEGTFFISVFDEIFLNPKSPHFERNRVSGGVGYQLNQSLTLQAGWVNQYNYTLISSNDKNNLMLTVSYKIKGKHSTDRERLPTNMD